MRGWGSDHREKATWEGYDHKAQLHVQEMASLKQQWAQAQKETQEMKNLEDPCVYEFHHGFELA